MYICIIPLYSSKYTHTHIYSYIVSVQTQTITYNYRQCCTLTMDDRTYVQAYFCYTLVSVWTPLHYVYIYIHTISYQCLVIHFHYARICMYVYTLLVTYVCWLGALYLFFVLKFLFTFYFFRTDSEACRDQTNIFAFIYIDSVQWWWWWYM